MKIKVRIQNDNKKVFNHVSFRKTSIGLVAVLIGSAFFIIDGQSVKADSLDSSIQPHTVVNQKRPENGNQNTKLDTASKLNQNSESTLAKDPDSNIKQKPAQITDSATNNGAQQVPIPSENVSVITSEDLSKPQMAGQNNIKVGIDINHLQPSNQEINLEFTNVGQDEDFLINASNLNSSNFVPLNDNWSFKHIKNGNILIKWTNENQSPNNLDISIPLIGNANTIKQNKNASIELYINGQKYGNKPIISTTLTPFVDTVSSDEIIKGFYMGEKTPESEYEYGNISSDDIHKFSSIQQWGFYFNYKAGEGTSPIVNLIKTLTSREQILNPLERAKFHVTLNGNQVLIPKSIRVFKVPAGMAIKDGNVRIGINDIVPGTNNTYYHYIANSSNENKDFEDFLKMHLTPTSNNPTGFSVDQSHDNEHDGYFYIIDSNGKKDYSVATESFFFQVDGGIPKTPHTKPSDGPISASWAEGFGTGQMTGAKVLTTGQIIGSGSGIDIVTPDKPDKPHKPDDHPSHPDDKPNIPDENPNQPVDPMIPENPTVPKTSDIPNNSNKQNDNNSDVVTNTQDNQSNGYNNIGKIINDSNVTELSHKKLTKNIQTTSNTIKNLNRLPKTNEKSQNHVLLGIFSLIIGLCSLLGFKIHKY